MVFISSNNKITTMSQWLNKVINSFKTWRSLPLADYVCWRLFIDFSFLDLPFDYVYSVTRLRRDRLPTSSSQTQSTGSILKTPHAFTRPRSWWCPVVVIQDRNQCELCSNFFCEESYYFYLGKCRQISFYRKFNI